MRRTRLAALAGTLALVASMVAVPPALAQSPPVLHSDFEDGTSQQWFGRGDAQVAASTAQARGGQTSLLTTGRTDTWQGPGRDLRGLLTPGAGYQIEAYVRLVAGTAPVTMTVQRRPAGGADEFDTVAFQVPADDSDWTRIAGAYSFSTADNEELQLYLESPDPTVEFYVDDVTVTLTSAPPGDPETPIETGFETGTAEGWSPRGPDEQVTAVTGGARTGDWSLLTTGRTDTWNGPSLDITDLVEAGGSYDFSVWLRLAAGQAPADLRLSVQRDLDGESGFDTVVPDTEVTADEWVNLTGSYTLAAAADAVSVYAESASALVDFHLDDFTMAVRTPPELEDIPPLHEVLADHFPVGAAIDQRELTGVPAQLLTRHFNSVTAENHMKPESIQPAEGEFTFDEADAIVAFAEANQTRVYGHTLVWHSQTPDWFFTDADGAPLTDSPEHRQLALDRMQAHIEAIADRYGDRVWAWDVVNEAIDESQDDGLRRSRWYEIIGPDYLEHAFRFAREAFGPDVKLFLNDFNTEFPAKREAMFQVVSRLQADGVPIDGVGHQLHLNLVRPVSWVDDSITRFRELGLAQAVTELDVSIVASAGESLPAPPPERLVRQGYYFRDLFEVLRSHSDVLETVTAWGLYDSRSWLRSNAPHEAPLFFDDDLQSKPAYVGVVDPAALPHLPQAATVPAATPDVDGELDLAWQQLPAQVLRAGEDGGAATGFQVRWDTEHLYVLAEVADPVTDPSDRVDLFVDDDNAKAGEYQDDDAHYTVARDGSHSGGVGAVEVVDTDDGYRIEAAVPLVTAGEVGREVGFDIRITDGAEQVSWSDLDHGQDADTSRWGTLTLVEQLSHVDIPHATNAPTVDGEVDPVWEGGAEVTTEVRVEGDPAGAQGRVRMLWDAQRLYLLAEVDDPQLDADNSNPWEHDSVEIFVNPGNTKSGAFQPADGQYRVNFDNHQTVNGDLAVIGDNLTSAAAVVDGGYVIEASIALAGMEPAAGAFIGLELQVNDATDGARTAVHTWHDPTGQSFQDTSRWGVARLVDADPVEPVCDRTVDGVHLGGLTVTGGTTCVEDATVLGRVRVDAGASLVAHDANLLGGVSAAGAATVTLRDVRLLGTVRVSDTTDLVELSDSRLFGAVRLTGNHTGDNPILVSGNTVLGVLSCTGNQPAPSDGGVPNTVAGVALGQCRHL